MDTLELEEAKQMQFRLVDLIHQNFSGYEILSAGDYGLVRGSGPPTATSKVEKTLAQFFGAREAVLTRGAGTGAIRSILIAGFSAGDKILIHKAPIYPTTEVSLRAMAIQTVQADYNNSKEINSISDREIKGALIQHTRQKLEDKYDLGEVIDLIKKVILQAVIVCDDNYAAIRVPRIGTQLGADVSTFSLFKLLGPEGIGCVLAGTEHGLRIIERIRSDAYSGGTQVQGPEAMDALRSLVQAPVMLAIQGEVVSEVARRLNSGEVDGVSRAYIANAQSRVILVEFNEPIADKILEAAWKHGAAPHPVGAESRYEISSLFYRVSGTFRRENPDLAKKVIRINPMRTGPETILRILDSSVHEVQLASRKP